MVLDERMMIDKELEEIWKKAVMFSLRYYPGISLRYLRKLRKTSVRIAIV
jgi:hypothetical protein